MPKFPWEVVWLSYFTREAPDVVLVHFCLESLILGRNSFRILPVVFKPICHESREEGRGSTLGVWPLPQRLPHTAAVHLVLPLRDSVSPRHRSRAQRLSAAVHLIRWGNGSARNMAASGTDLQTVLLISPPTSTLAFEGTRPLNSPALLGPCGPNLPASRLPAQAVVRGQLSSIHRLSASEILLLSPFLLFWWSYFIGFMLPRNLISITLVGLERKQWSVMFSGSPVLFTKYRIHILTPFPPALALSSSCLLSTQRSKHWALAEEENNSHINLWGLYMRLESSIHMAVQPGQLPNEYAEKGAECLKYDSPENIIIYNSLTNGISSSGKEPSSRLYPKSLDSGHPLAPGPPALCLLHQTVCHFPWS